MECSLGSNFNVSKQYFGTEQAPILVIDDFVREVDWLIEQTVKLKFEHNSPFYPGVRAATPLAYQNLILHTLGSTLVDFFQLPSTQLNFTISHYSIVNKSPEELNLLQRIPHFDSLNMHGLAAVHYLFKDDLGGTSFYRHRKTTFESVNEERKITYFKSLESENDGPHMPKKSDGYINGDTPLFERISEQEAKFNRIIIYRRNSLHSGSIAKDLVTDESPLNGRLTISSFIDC